MKTHIKHISVVFIALCSLVMATPVFATPSIEITRQPQNPTFPEGSVATYSVEAAGKNLHYTWFIEYDGTAYDTSKVFSSGERQPWDSCAMEGFGVNEKGNSFYFQGVLPEINGSKIYCVVSNGTTSVKSDSAYITVDGTAMPPELVVPSSMTVDVGTPLDLYCAATTHDGSDVEYLWYETGTGQLEHIMAINRGTETNSSLHCNTDEVGTHYYVCMVTTGNGGRAYTSVIPTIVREKPQESVTTEKSGETTKAPVGSETDAAKATDETTVSEAESSSSATKAETTISSEVTTGVETTVSNAESPEKEKSKFNPWVIVLPVVGFAVGGGSAFLFFKHKIKNGK